MSEPITPDEVRRLRLESGDRLIVRTADTRLASEQISHHQENLQAHFPDNEVLVIVADEIAVEHATPKTQSITVMSDTDMDKFAKRNAQTILPHGGIRVRQDAARREQPGDDSGDGLAGVPVRR